MLVATLALLAVAGWWAIPASDTVTFSGEAQGTTYSIKIAGSAMTPDGKHAVEESIHRTLARMDSVMSNYDETSELSRFNRTQTTEPVRVSKELVDVLLLARGVSQASDGAFDVTVAPLVAVWGFGPSSEKRTTAPTDDELRSTMERVGYSKLEIDPAAGTIRKTRPDLTCDVNGIAQGYTVDKLAGALLALGYQNFIVELGGEVTARGREARNRPWRAAIETPDERGDEFQRTLILNNMSLTTAGDYRNYIEDRGARRSHIIDPRTGRPVDHTLASVSVLHPDCGAADGYDTALMALGPEKGYDLAVRKGLAALFITRIEGQGFDTRATPQFDALTRH